MRFSAYRWSVLSCALFGSACSAEGLSDDASSGGSGTMVSGGTGSSSGGMNATGGAAGNASAGTAGATSSAGTTNGGSSGSGGSSSAGSGGTNPVEPYPVAVGCDASAQEAGTWQNVTPPGLDPVNNSWGGCQTILLDPAKTSDIYVNCDTQGTWRSQDCGMTWAKANVGLNADPVNGGRQWYSAIDLNPDRDPETDPTLYVTLGYGTGSLWKSTNAGLDWTNIWANIYAPDGTTEISADVGNDIHSVHIVDQNDPQHLIVSLHSYWGDGDNNGVFESTDGGGKWIVHKSETFNFQPHADILFPHDASTWMVAHSPSYGDDRLYRTTDSGGTWNEASGDIGAGMGRIALRVGNTLYGSSKNLHKSTDGGATWSEISVGIGVWTIFTDGTKLYVLGPPGGNENEYKLRTAAIDADTVWSDIPIPENLPTDLGDGASRSSSGSGVATNDGTHTIIVTTNWNAGVWRYVAP